MAVSLEARWIYKIERKVEWRLVIRKKGKKKVLMVRVSAQEGECLIM